MSSSDAELIVAHQACREVISYIKPSEIVGPYRGTPIREESQWRVIGNPSSKWVLASTLRSVQINGKVRLEALDEGKELESVTGVFVSLMTALIHAFRKKPLFSDDELTKRFCDCAIDNYGIRRELFPACQKLADSMYDLRRIRDLTEAMRDQLELGDQFHNPEWASLILEKKQSKYKQAREGREAEAMKSGEAEEAKPGEMVLAIR